jgi:hypothetical protein
MIRLVSRILSLVVVAAALWRVWDVHTGPWYVVLVVIPALVFIWFPETVDDYTFGTWAYGNRIDSHTPAFLIASLGWVLLFQYSIELFVPNFFQRLFGM